MVIAIIGILAALLFPALSKGKQKAQGVYCLNNGKQMIAALRMYADDFADWLPPNPEDSHSRNLWIGGDIGSESHKWRDRRTQLTGPYAPTPTICLRTRLTIQTSPGCRRGPRPGSRKPSSPWKSVRNRPV